ncbi:polyprotein [Frankliniella fusca]|uniref:Polyprotein n=1 Tax=Frankliniella fusca TaxID=407009 RepID=A0AAE1H9F5_9NEOP|nr:polyprotein [Frankliniella fusca]
MAHHGPSSGARDTTTEYRSTVTSSRLDKDAPVRCVLSGTHLQEPENASCAVLNANCDIILQLLILLK